MTGQTHCTILGYPRIGRERELKKALEAYWKGEQTADQLHATAKQLRADHWQKIQAAGIEAIPSGDFSYYDLTLDLTVALGALPLRYLEASDNALDAYFAAARGTQKTHAMEMTKWLNTNYHYIVPELGGDQEFTLNATKYVEHFREAKALGITTRPILVGPVSYLLLAKRTDKGDPLALLPALLPVYTQLLETLKREGVEWVQLDEPYLVTELSTEAKHAYRTAYDALAAADTPKRFVTSYFGDLHDNASLLASLKANAIHVDVTNENGGLAQVLTHAPRETIISLGVVNGRNIWRADLDACLAQVHAVQKARGAEKVWIASSCSLLHVPYSTAYETDLPHGLVDWLAYAEEKLAEITALTHAANGREAGQALLAQNRQARAARAASRAVHNDAVKQRLAQVTPADCARDKPYAERAVQQQAAYPLPLFPTTTIGSFPQTAEVRGARAKFRSGELSAAQYEKFLQAETVNTLRIQEELGLDVLVHGEYERTDMVEYFGEELEGFAFTRNGWVQSYGSRCVKPPIIFGDVSRKGPITVEWSRFAQSQTKLPVKGMLTGPVTILQWSFVRDDQPRSTTCHQIGLALRDEVVDLERAGIGMIQIDEPALREGLPLHGAEWEAYLEWSVNAFRLSAAGVKDATQIHTHMCYGDFKDVIEAIAALDADVISIETSRSHMELLDCFRSFNYPNAIGPGVYDIHSPRIPSEAEILSLLNAALEFIPAERLWVNPDCGLKTRAWPETKAALRAMVEATKQLRRQHEASATRKVS